MVTVGVTVGFEIDEVQTGVPTGLEVQEKVYKPLPPEPNAFSCEDEPSLQILLGTAVVVTLNALPERLTVTWSVLLHVLLSETCKINIVDEYIFVVVGESELTPVEILLAGVHE